VLYVASHLAEMSFLLPVIVSRNEPLARATAWDESISWGLPRAMTENRTISRSLPRAIAWDESISRVLPRAILFHGARGSLEETKYLLLLGKDLGFVTQEDYNGLRGRCNNVGKLLNGLINSLKEKE